MKVNRNTIFILLLAVYKILVEVCYANGIGVVYGYTGIVIKFSLDKELLSWFAFLVIIIGSSRLRKNYYIYVINMFLMVFSYIPTIALWGIKKDISYSAVFATMVYCVMMIFGANIISKASQRIFANNYHYAEENESEQKYTSLIIVLSVFLLLVMLACHQLVAPNRWFLTMEDSLSARLEIRESVIPGPIKYAYMIIGGSIAPILFVFGLKLKKVVIISLNVLTSYLAFTINGMKTYVLIYAVSIRLYYLTRKENSVEHVMFRITEGISIVWVISYLLWMLTGNHILISYMHRLITIPAEIHYYYFDFFSKNELLYLRDSIGRYFVESPYKPSASRVIGSLYYANNYTNATDGMFSDFYGNFGYFGLIVYPIIVFGVMAILGKQLKRHGIYLTISTSFIVLIVLINNTFFTWIITGGYLFSLILVWLINNVILKTRSNG